MSSSSLSSNSRSAPARGFPPFSAEEREQLPDGIGILVSFVGTKTVLRVRGELDLLSAPQLGAILHGVIDRGHHSVVLDLAELDFMDAAGLSVIAAGIRRLQPYGQSLEIRSPSAMVRRILDITDLAKLVHLEPSEP